MSGQLVTIGIPTYDRPELLARALESVAQQDYPNLEVIVSDNATPGGETSAIVASYQSRIRVLRYERQPSNIGPLANFRHLLNLASGQYFMWLADDDEISRAYVSALAAQLDADPTAVSAAGVWVLMGSEGQVTVMPTSQFRSRSALARAARFIWGSDDAWFYALHRTAVLRKARFDGYWWPNAEQTSNWAFVFLLDVLLTGRVLLVTDGEPAFFNHDYTAKSYALSSDRYRGLPGRAIRRLNVHFLYWRKCAERLGPMSLTVIVPTSIASLSREAVTVALRAVRRRASGWSN